MHSLYPSPCKEASSIAVLDGFLVFGTSSGSLSAFHWTPSDDGIASFHGEVGAVALSAEPVECLVAPPQGCVIACFTDAQTIHFVALVKAAVGDSAATREWRRLGSTILPSGCEYCNRSTAHCWVDKDHLLVGCFNGSVVCCAVPREGHTTGPPPHVLLQEDTPIIQLFHRSAQPALVVSSLRRNCTCQLQCNGSQWSAIDVTQIGQKNREEGLFGACIASKTDCVYASRHNHRVFEANKQTGTVLKTFKVMDDTPLGVLRPLDAGTLSDDEVAFWSEGANFCAIVLLSSNSECVWRYDCDEDDVGASEEGSVAVLGSAPAPHFQFVLLSNNQLLVVPTDSAWDTDFIPASVAHTVAPDSTCTPVATDEGTQASLPPNPASAQTTSAPNFLVDGQPVVNKVRRKVSIIKKVSIVKKKKKLPSEEGGDPQIVAVENTDGSFHAENATALGTSPVEVFSPNSHSMTSEGQADAEHSSTLPTSLTVDPDADDVDTHIEHNRNATVSIHDDSACSPDEATVPPLTEGILETLADDQLGSATAVASVEHKENDTPAEDEEKEPEVFSTYRQDLMRLYRTYCARQLDKKAQPQLLSEICNFVHVTEERLEDREDSPRRHPSLVAAASKFFGSTDEVGTLILLMRAGLEWLMHLPMPDEDRLLQIHRIYNAMRCMNAASGMEGSDWAELHESLVKHLGKFEEEHAWLNQLSAETVSQSFDTSVFPRFDGDDVKMRTFNPEYPRTKIEKCLCELDAAVVQELQFQPYPTTVMRQYFPYVFAVLPSKALQMALNHYPILNVRYLEWALSGAVQACAVDTLKRCNCQQVQRISSDELSDSLSEVLLLVVQEHAVVMHENRWCFPRAVTILLRRRMELLDAAHGSSLPVSVRQRKAKRIEEAIVHVIRTCPLNINIAHPALRLIFCDMDFPRGVVEIRGIDETISDSVAAGRIDKLLSLFQVPNAVNDSHWMTLFIASHSANKLESAMHLCFSVVQHPKKVRLLLRRAFPYMDTPELADHQLRSVSGKLAVLIGK